MDHNGDLFACQAIKVIQENPDAFERILAYLLYEKSIISLNDDSKRINHYLELVQDLSKGYHVSITSTFEKMVAIVFELVFSKKINPWNIDLVSFGKEYIERLERERDINLITIGKVVFMAWGVLEEKSEIILEEALNSVEDEYGEELDMMLGDAGPCYDHFLGPDINRGMVSAEGPGISEMIWRDSERKATLGDILGALAEAEDEVRVRKIIETNRQLLREREKTAVSSIKVTDNTHNDNLEVDKAITWAKIDRFNGHPIRLSQVCDYQDRNDVITTMISAVHLAHEKKINLWQRNFPYGEIYIRNLIRKHTN